LTVLTDTLCRAAILRLVSRFFASRTISRLRWRRIRSALSFLKSS